MGGPLQGGTAGAAECQAHVVVIGQATQSGAAKGHHHRTAGGPHQFGRQVQARACGCGQGRLRGHQ